MLTASPAPTQACLDREGRIERNRLDSALLSQPLEFRLYLPPCYDEQNERRYPVLYLLHGGTFYNDDQWDRLGADEAADRLMARGELPPFLIVMPYDRLWTRPIEDPFGEALIQELIPWIDDKYRTLTDREHRAIGGLSRGAGWAIHLGLSHRELFGIIGAHSLAVFDQDAAGDINRWLAELPRDALPRFYLDIGAQDQPLILKSAIWFEKRLTEEGIPHEWHLYTGKHEETYWAAHVEEYLRWYAEEW